MPSTHSGILKLTKKGTGHLFNPEDMSERILVPANLVQVYNLPTGATVTGPTKGGKRGPNLTDVETICGLSPEVFHQRTPFKDLIAISPQERFNLAAEGNTSMRLIDMMAPIGKGTRGLIVAPPKAGKTMLLEKLATAISTSNPDTRLIMLLIDERPEEVTHLRRALTGAEVFASSSDQPVQEHIDLSELMLAHIRLELECGRDVVVLVDSLTRLVRAFNMRSGRGGRTMSGGIEAEAMQIPRRFFGLARNIEHGGSVTILGSILVDTGSRMDDFIFEEFKGTGNSEIVLNRDLAEAYIFPALDLLASSTRREEQLYSQKEVARLHKLRRKLANKSPQQAMLSLLDLLDEYPRNEDLLASL